MSENRELSFSTREFGTSDVAKIAQIKEILADLFTDLTITVRDESQSQELEEFKNSIVEMLDSYAKVADLNELVNREIQSMLADGTLPSTDSLVNEINDYKEEIARLTTIVEGIDGKGGLKGYVEGTVMPKFEEWNTKIESIDNFSDRLKIVEKLLISLDLIQSSNFIQETNDKIGDLKGLDTQDKSDLVSAINEVFQSASKGKQLIIAALAGKGQTLSDGATYQQISDAISGISTEKPTMTKVVIPTKSQQTVAPDEDKVLSSVTVEAIPDNYVDTSDANATANDISLNKTAYVNGVKLTGTKIINLVAEEVTLNSTVTGINTNDNWVSAGLITKSNGGIIYIDSLQLSEELGTAEARLLLDGEQAPDFDISKSKIQKNFDETAEIQFRVSGATNTQLAVLTGAWSGLIISYS